MSNDNNSSGGSGCGTPIGVGTVLAALLSWWKWHSIWWAAFHALCGWFYVIYYLIVYGTDVKVVW